jgi:hypothetical protein
MNANSAIHAAEQWLGERLGKLKTTELHLEQILPDFTSQWRVIELIDAFINDSQLMHDLSRRTYRHSNGFDRIELLSSTHSEFGLRLHVWWGDEDAEKEHIHGHPWDFASRILVGILRVEQFIESASGDIFEVSEYDRPDGRPTYRLRHVGTATLRRILSVALPAGTAYSADHELLHRVWTDPGKPTVSLMLHGRGTAYPSRVFFPKGASLEIERERRRESPHMDSLQSTLKRVKALVSNGSTDLGSDMASRS